jgi:hypothetical protein
LKQIYLPIITPVKKQVTHIPANGLTWMVQMHGQLEALEVNGVSLDEVIAARERLPGMAALWQVATVEERREMVMLIVEPGGIHYDVEMKEIAAITPRPAFLPVLRFLEGVIEYEEATSTLVTGRWRQRNRRASDYLQMTSVTGRHNGPGLP